MVLVLHLGIGWHIFHILVTGQDCHSCLCTLSMKIESVRSVNIVKKKYITVRVA